MFNFFEELPHSLSWQLHCVTFLLGVHQGSDLSTSLPTLVVVVVVVFHFNISHPNA